MSAEMSPGIRPNESVFTWAAPPLKFGVGALDEIGSDVAQLGAESCLVITDPGVAESGIPERVRAHVAAAGVKCEVFANAGGRAHRREHRGGGGVRAGGRLGLLHRGRRRLGDRHRQGGQPAHHARR